MASVSNDIRNHINDVWQQAITQLEEVKDVVMRSSSKIDLDMHRLKVERDRLLRLLGEQTYRLAHQGKVPMPGMVRKTIDRLTDVIDRLVETEKAGGAKKKAKKKTAKKKATKKKTAKKATTSGAAPSKKKTAKKAATKKKTARRTATKKASS